MTKEEAIKRLERCISYLRSFGYQWALERAEEIEPIIDYIKGDN